MNKFNAMLYFNGEGSLTFVLQKVGEITIYQGKPLYLKNLDVMQVETLRSLRSLKLLHILNAKPDGAFKIYDCSVSKVDQYAKLRAEHLNTKVEMTGEELASNIQDIKKAGQSGPINETPEIVETPDNIKEALGDYILTSTKQKGKALKTLSTQSIKANLKKANKADTEAITKYLEQSK